MGGPDLVAVERLLVLVEDIFGQDEIEGAHLAIQPSFEEQARGKKAWIPLMRTLVSRT